MMKRASTTGTIIQKRSPAGAMSSAIATHSAARPTDTGSPTRRGCGKIQIARVNGRKLNAVSPAPGAVAATLMSSRTVTASVFTQSGTPRTNHGRTKCPK